MDGLILKINETFLQRLVDRGQSPYNIKIKSMSEDRRQSTSLFFSTVELYNTWSAPILSNSDYLSSFGRFPIIQNIYIDNKNFSFNSTYQWFDVTGKINNRIKQPYNVSPYQIEEIERYRLFHLDLFNSYTLDISTAIRTRYGEYAESGYVLPGYVN